MYTRPIQPTLEWIDEQVRQGRAGRGGQPRRVHRRLSTSARRPRQFGHRYEVRPAKLPPGEYTNITGNAALAWGLVAAGQLAKLPVTLGSYPITPASDILHELSKHKHFGVRTVQAEDEIAAAGMALGAAFAGHLGVTTTSGPGRGAEERDDPAWPCRWSCRCCSSTSSAAARRPACPPRPRPPTSTSPCSAATAKRRCRSSPATARRTASTPRSRRPASRSKYRTPVILLSDGYLANGSEPWRLPDVDDAARHLGAVRRPSSTHATDDGNAEFWPYLRDPETLARPWAIPGTPGLMHRIGGLEKADGTGNINYTPENHEQMVAPAGRQDRRHRRRHPAARDRRRSPMPTSACWLGLDLGRDRRRGAAHAGVPAARSRGSTSPTSTRCRTNLGEMLKRFPKVHRARAQPRPAVPHRARPSTWSTPRPSPRCRACRSPPARSKTAIERSRWTHEPTPIVSTPDHRKKDWTSDQEVRWCPGCGDYGILLAVQKLMPELGIAAREHRVHLAASAAPAGSRTT